MQIACLLALLLSGRMAPAETTAPDLDGVVNALQRRYASVESITGSFRQTYQAPGISQVESGVFRMMRPGYMRWEYRQPEEKLFIADGREVFLYSPLDRQVTIQPFSASDIHETPLDFLLGGADIKKGFSASWESKSKSAAEQTAVIRLTPRPGSGAYEYLILEVDTGTHDIRRLVIHEHGGNTSEFLLTQVAVNVKMGKKEFQFKPPKGVEVVRLDIKE